MHPFPHHYACTATATPGDDIATESPGLPTLATAAPEEFGGPGGRWSPETFFVASVATCFVLTFRAVAQAAGLSWQSLACEADGTLDRVERVTRFTDVHLRAMLQVPAGTDAEKARQALERAERLCLITNSLTTAVHLEAHVAVAGV